MKKSLCFFVLCSLLLASCWDNNEPERMLYIHGVGVDYKDGQFEIYAQLLDFSNIARSDQPSTDAIQIEVGHATGKTIDEAAVNLYRAVDQRILWGHLSYVVFSNQLLKSSHLEQAIDSFVRYRETRYTMWVYTTDEPLDELLLVTPILNKGMTYSRLADPLNSYYQESFIEPISLRTMLIHLDEPGHEVNIPFVVSGDRWETPKGVDPVYEMQGISVITKSQLKGSLFDADAEGLRWMTNETARAQITLENDDDQKSYTTIIVDKVKRKITPVEEGGQLRFDISIEVDVTTSGKDGRKGEEKLKKEITGQIKKEVERTYTKGLEQNMDVYRLSEQAYRKKLKAWKRLNDNGRIQLTEQSIRKLDVSIKNIRTERTTRH
ncbi:Ger(x)C family spore germination protein [Metasolibacillus sp.]|uniref:Ger(x)C family spore germination protein n=1 Tax=Metasolibacillus sp. TaxID=2703680 RepID=UPI0025FE00A8|nr:Ger(x)C family spore germination protein [Metasolibacillus sp.]MCT6925486.1 Ger(x)C family spore germination protein [Metasolibacillus sp.]MCT6941743.1 Ger(x)C family spore germination protein [Metasolibacillus sp.]